LLDSITNQTNHQLHHHHSSNQTDHQHEIK